LTRRECVDGCRLAVAYGFGAHPTGLLTVALHADAALDVHLFALNRDDDSLVRKRLQAATQLHDAAGLAHA